MTVTLNHTIDTALDNGAAARFFATVLGLECLPPAGAHGTSPRYGATTSSPWTP